VGADFVAAFVAFVVAGSEAADLEEEVSGEVSADRRVQAVISQIRIFTQIILALINRRLHPLGQAGSGWMGMATMQEDSVQVVVVLAVLHMQNLSPASRSWSAMYVNCRLCEGLLIERPTPVAAVVDCQ
jgi:hypothetical protein